MIISYLKYLKLNRVYSLKESSRKPPPKLECSIIYNNNYVGLLLLAFERVAEQGFLGFT